MTWQPGDIAIIGPAPAGTHFPKREQAYIGELCTLLNYVGNNNGYCIHNAWAVDFGDIQGYANEGCLRKPPESHAGSWRQIEKVTGWKPAEPAYIEDKWFTEKSTR
jgi:hypothetical protein